MSVQLVFVPSIGLSHIIPTVELAKRLLQLQHQHPDDFPFSITFLIIPGSNRSSIESITDSAPPSIRFIFLPPADLPPPTTEPGVAYFCSYIQNHGPLVKQHLSRLISDSAPNSVVRLIFDMFSSTVVDVARELSVPSYLYFTSSASMLAFILHLPALDSLIKSDFLDDTSELTLPSYINPVPTLSLPPSFLNKKSASYRWFLAHAQNFARCHGLIVNSFSDLELRSRDAFNRMAATIPPVYYPGPILNLEGNTNTSFGSTKARSERIKNWLDTQPPASVVFLCFGTRGSLSAPQLIEMANGLERSGQRFLWSIRCPPTVTSTRSGDYSNPEELLPSGFMDRVGKRGMLCEWAPQVEILGHGAVGAFVTHCGWNSILESVWFGVPMLTWPLDAEQTTNAFEVAVDLGIAAELKKGGVEVVTAEEVEMTVRDIIEGKSEVRRNVKQMSDKCRKAVAEGGSSLDSLKCLVDDLKGNILS